MFRTLFFLILFLFNVYGADRTIGTKDMSSFAMSGDLKAQIKAELLRELNTSLMGFRQDFEVELERKFDASEHNFKLDVVALQKEVKLLKEQVTLFKDMIVDTNYQRNLRDDKIRILIEKVKEIEKRLDALENKKAPPLENKTGEKI